MTAAVSALLLADGRLPVGGHAHSAGLEAGLAAGLHVHEVPDYLLARVRSVGRVEAAAAVLARRWALDTDQPDPVCRVRDLNLLHDELLARTPSAPLRDASAQLGRGLLRLADRLWPGDARVAQVRDLGHPPRPLALGVVAALGGLDDLQTARTSLFDDVQTAACAAPKLLPVDPLDPVAWVAGLGPFLEAVAAECAGTADLDALPSTGAPLVDQWSLAHHHRPRRIFRA